MAPNGFPSRVRKYHYLIAFAAVLLVLMVCALTLGGRDEDEKDLVRLMADYFSSWSEQRMNDYKTCFLSDAAIHSIDRTGAKFSYDLDRFVLLQTEAHRNADKPMREIPTDTVIQVQGDSARLTVRWKLFKGDQIVTGTDHFTVRRTADGWKIAELVFTTD